MGFALVLLIALALGGLWFLHKRRIRNRERKNRENKMLTWEPRFWHHDECEKVQPTKVCNCPGEGTRSASASVMCTCGSAGGPCRLHNPRVAALA